MEDWLNNALFGWYPYLALTVFVLGSLLRFDHSQYTWRTGSSQLLRRRQMMWGSNLMHVGILAIFGGHLVGLLTPVIVFGTLGISHTFKQLLAMSVGGIAGVACWIGIALLAHRRLFDARIRNTSTFADIAILLILWVQLTLGLSTIFISANHLDGHEMLKFMTWAQGIVTLNPGVAVVISDVSPIFKCHLFLGMTIFLLFPFTRLVHVWSAPIWYLGRKGYQIVRTTRAIAGRPAAVASAPQAVFTAIPIRVPVAHPLPAAGDD
jgi:nitrate reductase gamma subunit